MPRHKFTLSEQLRGTERALNSSNTPKRLVESLRLRAGKLRKQIAKQESQRKGFS
jgi:hypothetical protein